MNDVDMSQFIAAKSDQLTADDLTGGPRTITITRVTGNEGNAEQPVNIYFEGDDGKPWRPCKIMRRVMVAVWQADTKKYVGRSMTLFRDPKVKWGGMEVGGIRISHMTGLDSQKTLAIQETRGAKKPYKVMPLKDVPQQESDEDPAAVWAEKFVANCGRAPDLEKLNAYVEKAKDNLVALETERPDLHAKCDAAIKAKRAAFAPSVDDDDPFAEGAD